MKPLRDHDVERLLRQGPEPVPPRDLLARLREELPESIDAPGPGPSPRRPLRRLALAASVLIAVGGSFLGLRTYREMREETRGSAPTAQTRTEPSPREIATTSPQREAETAVEERIQVGEEEEAPNGARAAEPSFPAPPEAPPSPASDKEERSGRVFETRAQESGAQSAKVSAAERVAPAEEKVLSEGSFEVERQTPPPAKARRMSTPATHPEPERRAAPTARTVQPVRQEATGEPTDRRLRADSAQRQIAMEEEPAESAADAPYDAVTFQGYDIHPFVEAAADPVSTFGLDVDTASWTLVRRYLDDGHLPPPEAVRAEELINYFDYGDPAPDEGDFALTAEGAPSPHGEPDRRWLLRFHLHAREVAAADRPPVELVFVVDVSGSMAREHRLELVKEALGLLLAELRPDDRVGLVVYGSRGEVLLEPTSDLDAIRDAIGRLQPGGSTNAEEGLVLGYQLLDESAVPGTIRRVVLCSDGVANVGRTDAGSLLDRVARHAEQGIELTTVGFGMGNYNDVLLEQLADRGDGRYAYVDDLSEAHRIFVENLTGTLLTVAAEARSQVTFDPEIVERYRLIGYENREIPDERFRDDTVDAGEIGAGHGVTALYELELRRPPRRRDELAVLRLRYRPAAENRFVEDVRIVTGRDFAQDWEEASPALRWTSLVAELAEVLRGSGWAQSGDLDELSRRAQRLGAELPGNPELTELVELIGRAARLTPQKTL